MSQSRLPQPDYSHRQSLYYEQPRLNGSASDVNAFIGSCITVLSGVEAVASYYQTEAFTDEAIAARNDIVSGLNRVMGFDELSRNNLASSLRRSELPGEVSLDATDRKEFGFDEVVSDLVVVKGAFVRGIDYTDRATRRSVRLREVDFPNDVVDLSINPGSDPMHPQNVRRRRMRLITLAPLPSNDSFNIKTTKSSKS